MPAIASLNGQASADCPSRLQAVWDILVFFAVNVLAHCLTMRDYPGQLLSATLWRSCRMAISPVTAGRESFEILEIFTKSAVKRWSQGDCTAAAMQGYSRFHHWAAYGGYYSIDAAIRSQAVAICVPEHYLEEVKRRSPWIQVTADSQKSVFMNGTTPTKDELDRIYLVPSCAHTVIAREIIPQGTGPKNAISLFQLVYTSFQLFYSDWSTIKKDGLSSPYVVAVPYLAMSSLNLLVNCLVASYTCVTILRPLVEGVC